MTEKQLAYYEGDSVSAPYISDLYEGKIHIYFRFSSEQKQRI